MSRLAALLGLAWLLGTVQAQTPTIAGCFNASEPLTLVKTSGSNSVDTCNEICQSKNKNVLGLHKETCWCGDKLPPTYTNVGPRFCDSTCPGNSSYVCGGSDGSTSFYTLWLTELEATVPNIASLSSSSTASSATSTGSSKTTGSPKTTGSAKTTGSTKTTGSPKSTGTKAESTSTSSAAASGAGSQANSASSGSGNGGDEDLAIILGTILGAAALLLMLLVFWWVWRRRKRTGDYARYHKEAPDSASALRPDHTAASSTAPEMSMRSPTDSETGGIGGPAYAPPIYVQQPTPATATLRSQGSFDEGNLIPTAMLAPGSAASSQYSSSVSNTDPYYTPLEQPSISHFNQSELNSIRTRSQHRPSSSIADDERDDVLSPLETIVRPERVGSRDRINNFDFAFENERYNGYGDENDTHEDLTPMPTMDMPGYFGTFYDDGR